MFRFCPVCAKKYSTSAIDFSDTFNYCSTCGTQTKAVPQCECKTEILPSMKFCRKCGKATGDPYGLIKKESPRVGQKGD